MGMQDHSCFSFMTGNLGQLQTLKRFNIVAGDSWKMSFDGIFRLPPLRTFMARDVQVDVFCFFNPHRHIYGQDWIDFINDGEDETVTFPASAAAANVGYLGGPLRSGPLPLYMVSGYAKIWNRYFRSRTDTALMSETLPISAANERIWGRKCARLPSLWSTPINSTLTDSDREVVVSGGTFDIVNLSRTRASYQTKSEREWEAPYYNDVLRKTFGGSTNTDADERPTVLYRAKAWLSGHDVDGTSGDSLGDYAGKSFGRLKFDVPRRYFGEHGQVWVMALLRFPTVHATEAHYLDLKTDWSYLEMAGDPELISNEPPFVQQANEFFSNGGANNLGTYPYAQWMRAEPSVVGSALQQQQIYPYLNTVPTSFDTAFYSTPDEYDFVFKDTSFGNWALQAAMYCDVDRRGPGPRASVFAGVRD